MEEFVKDKTDKDFKRVEKYDLLDNFEDDDEDSKSDVVTTSLKKKS